MSVAQASFHERLERINAGQGYVAEGLLAQGELETIRQRQSAGKAPTPSATTRVREKRSFPLMRVLAALLLGIISFFGGSLGAFHATQSAPSEFDQYRPLVEALGPVGLSGILAFFLLYVSGLRSVWMVGVIAAGFFGVHYAEPHMARAAPEAWTQMYSADHTDALKFKAFAQMVQWGLAPPPDLATD